MLTKPKYTLDLICQKRTAFRSFDELVNGTHPSYRPSCDVREPEIVQLADAYDAVMEARGDSRRAYRYGEPKQAPAPVANRPGTTIINGYHVTLTFETERDGSVVSSCFLTRNRQCASLEMVKQCGGFDNDEFIEIPGAVITKIEKWACGRGY